jgi:hypothetical protein
MEERFAQNSNSKIEGKEPAKPLTIRKVTGCGRNHGFQLVVDSQQMMTLLPR